MTISPENRGQEGRADMEANIFALYLLMPDPHFSKAMKGVDMIDDQALGKVARKFKVTIGAVMYRASLAASSSKETQ